MPPIVLQALLSYRSAGGKPLEWAQMVIDDLRHLQILQPRLDELGDPINNCKAWHTFIFSFPSEWSELCKCVLESKSNSNSTVDCRQSDELEFKEFVCMECEDKPRFSTCKGLDMHRRKKHGFREPVQYRIAHDVTACPRCKTEFHQRFRLLKHVLDRRRQSLCLDFVASMPALSTDDQVAVHEAMKEFRKEARSIGRTPQLACQTATNAKGRKCGRAAMW